jgi:hypothetical protein
LSWNTSESQDTQPSAFCGKSVAGSRPLEWFLALKAAITVQAVAVIHDKIVYGEVNIVTPTEVSPVPSEADLRGLADGEAL